MPKAEKFQKLIQEKFPNQFTIDENVKNEYGYNSESSNERIIKKKKKSKIILNLDIFS